MFFHLGHISLFWCTCYFVRSGVLGICQGEATHFDALWHCMWGRGQRGNNAPCSALAPLSVTSPISHKRIVPFWCLFPGGWVLYILGPCRSLQWTLLWGWKFLPPPQPPQVFSVRNFEALFPCAGTLGCTVCVTPQLFLPVFLHTNVVLPSPPAVTLPWLLSAWLPASIPPTSLNECFLTPWLLEFHTVRFPVSSGCFFVFKFVVLLLVVRGGTVCLPTPPSWLEVQFCLLINLLIKNIQMSSEYKGLILGLFS